MKKFSNILVVLVAVSAIGCHHDQPKTPDLYSWHEKDVHLSPVALQPWQVPPVPVTNEQKAETAGAYVAGKTYRAGEATYEYLTSEKMKERARRVKAYMKEKAVQGLDATKEILEEELIPPMNLDIKDITVVVEAGMTDKIYLNSGATKLMVHQPNGEGFQWAVEHFSSVKIDLIKKNNKE